MSCLTAVQSFCPLFTTPVHQQCQRRYSITLRGYVTKAIFPNRREISMRKPAAVCQKQPQSMGEREMFCAWSFCCLYQNNALLFLSVLPIGIHPPFLFMLKQPGTPRRERKLLLICCWLSCQWLVFVVGPATKQNNPIKSAVFTKKKRSAENYWSSVLELLFLFSHNKGIRII